MRPRPLRTAALTLLLALASGASAQDEPIPSDLVEKAETRIVQLDVSVLDPRGDTRRSVPGLSKELFVLRVGGHKMSEEEYERVTLDEICGEAREGLPEPFRQKSLVLMLDFNYLGGQKRFNAAGALRELAAEGLPEATQIRVVGYTRSIYEILPFTSEAADLLRAAEFLEEATWVGGPGIDQNGEGAFAIDFQPPLFRLEDRSGAGASLGADGQIQGLDALLADISESPGRQLVERGQWDPRASLAAIEAVLRAHAGLPGRKALVLFTGESFDLPPDDLERETAQVFRAAQFGFTIWAVDAEGFFAIGAERESVRPRSRLVTMLAGNTGGETLRSAPDLGVVFPRIEEHLSCYYLFSIPVRKGEGTRAVGVTVALDTRNHPELFSYVVKHRSRLHLEDRVERRERLRVAALLSPQAWNASAARAELAFPVEWQGRLTHLPVEVSLPLRDLDFLPEPDGGYAARFLFDATVVRDGKQVACSYPARGEAVIHQVRMPSPPDPDFRGHLVIRDICPFRGAGLYSLRSVMTDPEEDRLEAAHATFLIEPRPGEEILVASLRAGHNTGHETLLFHPEGGQPRVVRDMYRTAFIPLLGSDAAHRSDRLMFRYVVCGPSREEAKHRIRRLIYRREGESFRNLTLLEKGLAIPENAEFPRDPFCVEIHDSVPPNTLERPGDYGFAVVVLDSPRFSRRRLERALAGELQGARVSRVEFPVE
jgi:VWFA-related protein